MDSANVDIHTSVLLEEVIRFLQPVSGGVYVDGNLGMGGHTERILQVSTPDGKVVGFDWDMEAVALAQQRLAVFGERFTSVVDNFASLPTQLENLRIGSIDGLLLDLGLSSYQLDKSERGFSFKGDQPLDMRMDSSGKQTAADLVNRASEDDLADIFYHFGEERQARRIASFVIDARHKKQIISTAQLVEVIEQAVPRRFRPKKIHVATKVFQALRIAVNSELDNLVSILDSGPKMLKNGAKICIISFHSLEDRLVKRAFQNDPSLKILTKKPVMAGAQEVQDNPRARSARLRVAIKVET